MPELPEVETVRRQLAERLNNATIIDVVVWRSGREFPSQANFVNALKGRRIKSVDRRAKLLIWRLDNRKAITAHLKMTGRFLFVDQNYKQEKHDRIRFILKEKNKKIFLVWADIRQFGFLKLIDESELNQIVSEYGPEPLDVSAKVLAERLNRSSTRSIKATLLDQAIIAGIGNIYADESLHRAGIRPHRCVAHLSLVERLRLAQEIQNVLQESINQQGASANDYVDTQGQKGGFLNLLRVYGRAGEPCRTCDTSIQRTVLAQRGTHHCPTCQK